jgi:hypothetical protein
VRKTKTNPRRRENSALSGALAFGAAFIVGALCGAGLGLAYAPSDGAEARRAIARCKDSAAGSALFLWDVARDRAVLAQTAGASRFDRLVQAVEAGLDEARRVQQSNGKSRIS